MKFVSVPLCLCVSQELVHNGAERTETVRIVSGLCS